MQMAGRIPTTGTLGRLGFGGKASNYNKLRSAMNNMHQQQRYYGLNGLDQKLEAYLDYDGSFFVEIGAPDGVTQSNTPYFEQYRQWFGLLVEPAQINYVKCRANRSPNTKIFCAACVPFGYTERFVPIVYSRSPNCRKVIFQMRAHTHL